MTTCRPMPAHVTAWMASRGCEIIGRTRMSRLVGLDVEDMRRVSTGQVLPTAKQREAVERVFASLLSAELGEDGMVVACACGEDKRHEEKQL